MPYVDEKLVVSPNTTLDILEVAEDSTTVLRRASVLVAGLFSLGANLSAEPLPTLQPELPPFPTVGQLVGFATTADGDNFTINRTFDTPPFGGGILRRLDAAGHEIWSENLGGSPLSIAVSLDKTACVIVERDFLFGLQTQLVLKCIAPGGPTGSDPEVNLPGFTIFGLGSGIGANVAIDQARDRIYVFVPSIDFHFDFRILTIAYDRSLNLIAQRPHVFENDAGIQQIASLSVDDNGSVWTSGVEVLGYPQPSRVFIARHPPNLTAAPDILRRALADTSIMLKAAGDPRGGVVIAGDRDASGNLDTFQRISTDEFGNLEFGAIFRIPGYVFEPFAVDSAGSIYAPGFFPGSGTRTITKRGPTNLASWSPEYLPLPVGRDPQFIRAPIADTFDVAGTVAGGSPTTFISRYVPGVEGLNKLVAISPLDADNEPRAIGIVGSPLPELLTVEIRDSNNIPRGSVGVEFEITSAPARAVGQSLFEPDMQSNSAGLAASPFSLGNIPLEYEVAATCPSCNPEENSAVFQICGKYPVVEYSQFDYDLVSDRLDNHSEGLTIRDRGCALTAFTMLSNIYRERYSFIYPHRTPREMNVLLSDSNTYGFVGNALLLYGPALRHGAGGRVIFVGKNEIDQADVSGSLADLMPEVDASLGAGEVVLFKIVSRTPGLEHFLTIIGKCGSKYLIADPAGGQRTTFDIQAESNLLLATYIFRRGT